MKNKKGFTLVELLVVIAIIGILSSVAVVNLNSARDKAKRAAVLASLSGLGPAIQLCLDESTTANLFNVLLNDGSATAVDICSDADITTDWPKINQHGFNYDNSVIDANPTAGTWAYKAVADSTTLANINCTQAGCS
ncbi:MAG: Type II secretion system subunit H, I [Parcubacteria group bacterium GW2011_GWA2_36_10]|nr:MAG: Type II secretion system subunit H, I [Parcubacteria group bacterium GW2011_GWA2_36_10]